MNLDFLDEEEKKKIKEKIKKDEVFKDTSIFHGIKEFTTPVGDRIRAMNQGNGKWNVFLFHEDSYRFDETVWVKGNATCQKIYDAYREQIENYYLEND